MAGGGVSGRIVILSFNFNCNFFQRHCVMVQSQKRCVIFSTKELQKELAKSFFSDKEYCLVSYIGTILNTCLW